jgi:hypothetical protein
MIDEEEEDIEKLLKRRISWKSLLKGIFGLLFLGGAILLIQFSQTADGVNYTFFLLGITLMCMASTIMVPIPKKEKDVRHTISILKCEKCGSERVQDYKDGDFVHKDSKIACKNCDGHYKIQQVYSLKLKPKAKIKGNKTK